MNFEFNENQNDLRAMVRELAEKEIGPRAKENDEKDVFPVEIYKMMADMGLTAIGVPEEFGGPEATDIERMIAIEEIRHRRTEKEIPSQNCRRRILHSIRPYRARRRFRPGFRKDNGSI